MTESKKKLELPFKIVESEVSGGFIDSVHTAFTGGIDVANYHEDKYGNFDGPVLQSPFTQRWVGGKSHRHVEIGTEQQERPEAWHLDFVPNGVRFYSNAYRSSPPAYWSRQGLAKRPLNISNIKNSGLSVGNFSNNYEVLQTSGRRITNNLIVDGYEYDLPLTTQFVKQLQKFEQVTTTEDFSSYSTGDTEISGFIGDLTSQVRTRVADNPGKKYFVLRGNPVGGGRFLQTENMGEINEITYTFIVYVLNGITYDYNFSDPNYGLALEDPDTGENLVLEYSYDGNSWITKKTIFLGSIGTAPYLRETTETVDLSVEKPAYVRFRQTAWSTDAGNEGDNYGITDISISSVKEVFNYFPELDSVTGSKSIFVERFNAPGSKEESSRRSLDREGEEVSPNIPLPFRNHYVRKSFYGELSQSTPQFGSTIHGTNRNTLVRAGNIQRDNGFIVNSLPRTDIQYSWITASAYTTAEQLGGYQSFGGNYNRSEAYTDISFVSSSAIAPEGTEIFIDNLFINSQIKDKKKIRLDTRTVYMSASLSASMSEYVNSPYTFTTWTSLRNADHLVAKNLRKNNILSVQDQSLDKVVLSEDGRRTFRGKRGEFAKNFTDPAVTFKYKPLRHKFIFTGNNTLDISHDVVHTYSNNVSTFANKSLLNRLGLQEDKPEFYDLIYNYYVNPGDLENNPIDKFINYQYKEIVWPREENTGLSKTRKRSFYYLDKPGFSRDGFDIQLGTQRVFWRTDKEDRKRSNHANGGYYSSMGHLSLEESGSNFIQNDIGVTSDNKFVIISSSFEQNPNIDTGIFSSISNLEENSIEKELYVFTGSLTFKKNIYGLEENYNFGDVVKRGFSFDSSGEWNSLFNDFYEQTKNENELNKRSIGSIYRNTSYKSLLTEQISEKTELLDKFLNHEDDQIFVNPKLRFLPFVGGVELNTGSFIQDENNFSKSFKNIEGILGTTIKSIFKEGNDIYIGGRFVQTGDVISPVVSKINIETGEWTSLNKNGELLESYTAFAVLKLDNYIYVGGNFPDGIRRYNLQTEEWSTLGTGTSGGFVYAIEEIDGAIVIGGSFTSAGGAGFTSKLAVWAPAGTGGTWYPLDFAGTEVPNADVHSLLYYNNNTLFIGGSFTGTSGFSGGRYLMYYDFGTETFEDLVSPIDDGSSFTAGTIPIRDLKIKDDILYVGGNYNNAGGIGAADYISKYDLNTATWSALGSSSPVIGVVESIAIDDQDIYFGGDWSLSYNAARWNLTTDTVTNFTSISDDGVFAISKIDNNSILFGGEFSSPYDRATVYNISEQQFNSLQTGINYNTFSKDLFSQELNLEDVVFSTIDNGLILNKSNDSFYDSYEDYHEEIRSSTKDFSILSEFNISDKMEFYVKEKNGNFKEYDSSFLVCDGADTYISGESNKFLTDLALSDVLKKQDEIRKENKTVAELEKINITVSGIKKLLPYNGFYPQDRVTQIGNLYKDYINNSLHGGTYNVSYYSDYSYEEIYQETSPWPVTSISVERYNNKYYAALGQPNRSTKGEVKIISSEGDSIQNFETVTTFQPQFTGNSSCDFGNRVKIVSASNGLNLFISSFQYNSTSTNFGHLFHSISEDGLNWTEPARLLVEETRPYGITDQFIGGTTSNGRFGEFFDLVYDQENEKIVIAIGEPTATVGSFTNAGKTFIVTGSLTNNFWTWSDKILVKEGTKSEERIGTGVSLVKLENELQLFFGSVTHGSSNEGAILYSNSSDFINWSTSIYVALGEKSHLGLTDGVGTNDIEAISFKDKTYVFYSDPKADYKSLSDVGITYLVSSSAGNNWGSIDVDSEKTIIYSPGISGENSPSTYEYSTISIYNESDNRLHYAVANTGLGSGTTLSELVIGNTTDGQSWQTSENGQSLIRKSELQEYYLSLSVTEQTIGSGEKVPVFITDSKIEEFQYYSIKKISNNQFINYSLKVSGSEKHYEHAALEPILGPGILYNTIKSGIAVDWPCITGSQTSLQPYGDTTIVNAYYPKSYEMANFSGSNVYESAYGNLRSIIDYRIPFENVIFPDETFTQKLFLESDLVTQTTLTQISETDPVAQFLNGTYVYGGYEPYISPLDVGDVNNLGPKRFSVPFVYRKYGSNDSGLYSLAVSNFLAETVKFFLKDEKMVTFESTPDTDWPVLDPNKTYYMDVVLQKTNDLVMMEAFHSDLHPTGVYGEKMNGRYFGYPVNKTTKEIWGEQEFTEQEKRLIHNDPAYAPYTPPYFEGQARARISFKPEGRRTFTLAEILEGSSIENIFTGLEGAEDGSDAKLHKMPVGSSVELKGFSNPVQVSINEQTGERTITSQGDSQRWIISPKMETPVLDFSNNEIVPYQNNYSKSGGFGKGMWAGFGQIPQNQNGIKMWVEYPFRNVSSDDIASLAEVVGFSGERKDVGQLADEKLISEAIMLVPYLSYTNELTITNDSGFNFIGIDNEIFQTQKENIEAGRAAIPAGSFGGITESIQSTSISQMIEKMKKYVIPPHLDFVQFDTVHPFVAYIFEFEHLLDQQDLSNIWQGVMPKISTKAELEQVEIEHGSSRFDLFGGNSIPDNLRWLVFKVKRKGEYNYFNVTKDTKDDKRFDFNQIIGREQGTDVYSYNWPYDYFSLVESAKVEISLEYKNKENE